MSCQVAREQLWAFALDELADAGESARLAEHVSTCPDCTSQVAEMRALVGDLAALQADTQRLDAASPAPGPAALPEQLGGYRIVRKIGEGGMGLVFEAEQQSPRRPVALKVIRAARFADELSLKLFRREAQTLGRLNHPGVAAIYESGVADGQHFLAMELVAGRPLSAFVADAAHDRRGPLGLHDRARLFLRICEAIAYAHQRGVLHRDLKPSNILVTADGQPKVLDFGLARMTEADPAHATRVSETGRIMGTLPYMSPEQAAGVTDGLDVRSDVYSLGVILYELLTGRLPFPPEGRPLHEVVRAICEHEPPALRSANAAVPFDLATICLKALEKPPERRYQTAAELADDVRRFLERRPIVARPATAAYRFRKFVARNALPVTLLSTLFLVVLGAAIGLALQARLVAAQRDAARREAAKFEQINRVLTETLRAPSPWERGDKDTTVLQVLDALGQRIERELRDQPLVAAAIRHTLGSTYRAFSEYDKAVAHLEFAWTTRAAALGQSAPETVDALDDLGEVRYERGDLDRAEPELRRALELRRATLPDNDPRIAESLNSVGLLALQRGRLDEAGDLLNDALQRRTRTAAQVERAPAADARTREEAFNALAQTHNNLGVLHRRRAEQRRESEPAERTRELEAAAPHFAQALALRRQWLGESHPETAKQHNNLANLMSDLGRSAEAEASYRAALAILLEQLGEQHRFTAQTRFNLASLYFEARRFAEARREADAALAVQEQVLGSEHPQVARTRQLLADLAAAETPAPP